VTILHMYQLIKTLSSYKSKYYMHFISRLLYFFAILLTLVSSLAAQEHDQYSLLKIPTELQSDVSFWIRIYSSVSRQRGLLHDSENLNIIYYETSDNRIEIDNYRKKTIEDLNLLAESTDRSNLNNQQIRILESWGENTEKSEFRKAAQRIRWQRGQSENFLYGLERSRIYKAYGEKIANQKSLPNSLLLLPHLESSFNATAVSSANAVGMWQFTRSTGKDYMQIDNIIDERLDPYISTRAGLTLLKDYFEILESWPLAITAYNHGITGVRAAVKELGTKSITEILRNYKGPRFGFASRNFYPQFLAVSSIVDNLDSYFPNVNYLDEKAFDTYRTNSYLTINQLSENSTTPIKDIISLNPSFLVDIQNGRSEIPAGYQLKLPLGSVDNILKANQSISSASHNLITGLNNIPPDNYLKPNQNKFLATQSTNNNFANDWVNDSYLKKIENLEINLFNQDNQISASAPELALLSSIETTTDEEPDIFDNEASSESKILNTKDSILNNNSKHIHVDNLIDPEEILDFFDFDVDYNGMITLLPNESLSDIAFWLGEKTWDLRSHNNISLFDEAVSGQVIDISFSSINISDFKTKRFKHHANLISDFLEGNKIIGTTSHVIDTNNNLIDIAKDSFSVPMWLVAFYNPDIPLENVFKGQIIVFPIIGDLSI